MPSVSKRQHNYMEMIAHGGKPKGKKGPSVKVAKDFVAADKGRNLKALPTKVSRGTSGADGNPMNDDGLGSTVAGRKLKLRTLLKKKRGK